MAKKMTMAEQWTKIAQVLDAMHNEGNNKALDSKYFMDCGVPVDCHSLWTGKMSYLWIVFKDYQTALRNAAGLSADELPDKDRKALEKPVWAVWSEVCHGLGLRCHKDDLKMIYRHIERIENDADDKKQAGTQKPYYFRKGIEIELGMRLADVRSKSAEEIEYEVEKRKAIKKVASIEKRLEAANLELKNCQKLFEKAKGTPVEEDVAEMLQEAEQEVASVIAALEKARNREKALTLDSVRAEIQEELSGTKTKKVEEDEEEKAEEAPAEEAK